MWRANSSRPMSSNIAATAEEVASPMASAIFTRHAKARRRTRLRRPALLVVAPARVDARLQLVAHLEDREHTAPDDGADQRDRGRAAAFYGTSTPLGVMVFARLEPKAMEHGHHAGSMSSEMHARK
jgi:hypothetical protein